MTLKCEDVELDLTRYVSGDYERIKDFDGLAQHLHECQACQKCFLELKETVWLLRVSQGPSTRFQAKMDKLTKHLETMPMPKFKG